jgi:demethylmenaquinone methyltransferase/2-methoxy-6-polyprenyl-1,4-benzoquinol methylase/phosphoethanolamine N-methyltransferase
VLDVGCGTGDLTQAAKVQAGSTSDVYGIDASPEMIEVAWRKAARAGVDIHYRVDLIEALSFPDDTFDVVLSSLMIHHLPDELKRKGLAEICRVLKPNGCLIVVDMNRPTTLLGKVMMHVSSHGDKPIGLQDLPSLMHKTGFVQIETGRMLLGMLGFARGRTPT